MKRETVLDAVDQVLPELAQVRRARESAGHADDCQVEIARDVFGVGGGFVHDFLPGAPPLGVLVCCPRNCALAR